MTIFLSQTTIVRVMAYITSSVEYGIHCLLWLVKADDQQPSSRDLAELQGVSPSFVAKIFPKLEKAGIVQANEGVQGGYRLAKPAAEITVLDIVDAIEGTKPLFDCQEIRGRCAVFNGDPPAWATKGYCSIHKVMLRAEKSMREVLAEESLESLSQSVDRKAPSNFGPKVNDWLSDRRNSRRGKGKRKRV